MFWHLAHALALGLWGGIVMAEVVLELVGRTDRPRARLVARVHYLIDLFCEGPVMALVVATGAVLAFRVSLSLEHWIKIACGSLAVLVNAWCILIVLRRHRRFDARSEEQSEKATSLVFLAAKLGLPAALVALYLGLKIKLGW